MTLVDALQMRLELLKLTYSHGRPAVEAVARAEDLEKYVVGTASSKVELKTLTMPGKKDR